MCLSLVWIFLHVHTKLNANPFFSDVVGHFQARDEVVVFFYVDTLCSTEEPHPLYRVVSGRHTLKMPSLQQTAKSTLTQYQGDKVTLTPLRAIPTT